MITVPYTLLGDVTGERLMPLVHLPKEFTGVQLRQLSLYSAAALARDPANYYVLEVGRLDHVFHVLHTRNLQGLRAGLNILDFQPRIRYSAGDTLALRLRPVGDPDDLTDVSAAPIFIIEQETK